MDKTWFANKGQVVQLIVPTIGLCLSASDKVHFAAFPYAPIALAACAVTSVFMIVREHRATRKAVAASTMAPLDPYTDPRTLGLRLLRDDLSYILEHYRPLDHDYPSRVRLPLSNASWPAFGEKWDSVSAELHSMAVMTSWTMIKVRNVWAKNGWAEHQFRLFRATEMVNVLVGLQECIDWLKQQIEKP
jgi:hypothetical protein